MEELVEIASEKGQSAMFRHYLKLMIPEQNVLDQIEEGIEQGFTDEEMVQILALEKYESPYLKILQNLRRYMREENGTKI